MTDKPTPTDAATPECLTCSDHGAVGNSGFDYKTAADFLSGKTVIDEALRKFVAASRRAHDARAALHAKMLSLQGELASREAEIALLKRSLLDAEAAPQPPTAPATQQAVATKEHVHLVRVIADKIEDGTLFRSGIYSNKDLARFVRNVADAAAPQPSPTAQAAESVPALDRDRIREIFMAHGFTVKEGQTDLKQYVYDAAEALLRAARAQADSVQEDVVRMNWLDTDGGMCVFHIGKTWYTRPSYGLPHRKRTNLRAAIDAAMADAARAAQKEGEKT